MIPECGTFALTLACCFCLWQFMTPKTHYLLTAAVNQFAFTLLAFFLLIFSFLNNDITLPYVREHSHPLLPILYKVGAAWSGHDGSLLLWCLTLSGWGLLFVFLGHSIAAHTRKMMIKLLGLISAGFLFFLLFTSNPFKRDFPSNLVEGNSLAPVLQDPGLILHPPMLYLGYVGFVIPFVFAIAILLLGKFEKKDAENIRPWVLLPWGLLSGGIVLGSWWAYRELGWGGWWFWDPVENASLMPWLCATALLHSLIVTKKTERFYGWTLFLAIITFAFSLTGALLIRSGVLVSVHAFANDPTRGIFLLCYVGLLMGGTFFLYAAKIKYFYKPVSTELSTQNIFLLLNNVFLLTAAAGILLGTIYPVILASFSIDKISIGTSYFDTIFLLLMLPLLLFMGLALHDKWRRLGPALLCALFLSLSIPKLFSFPFYVLTTIGLTLGMWVLLSTLQYFTELWWDGKLTSSHWAMLLSHIGIAILVLGITVNKSFSEERQVKMSLGETTSLAGYQFYFKDMSEKDEKNYKSLSAHFLINPSGESTDEIISEMRLYTHEQLFSKTGIHFNVWRDLSVTLGPSMEDGSWSIRLYYKPLVRWIWLGGFLLLSGVLLTLLAKKES